MLILAFIAANLPFLVERIFFVGGGIAWLLEGKLGNIHEQNWEFYAANASLFVVFAYPGVVYHYLWRRRGA